MKSGDAQGVERPGWFHYWTDGVNDNMPIRVITGTNGNRRTENLTDLVARMTGRYPVYNDDKHIKARQRKQRS